MTQPGIKFTVDDYMTAPEEKRYQLLDGEMVLAPSPTSRHQAIVRELSAALHRFVTEHELGQVWFAPLDVVLSDHDVAQPDLLYVSGARAGTVTEANIQGAPDLVAEVLSPDSTQHDRGYKRTLYGRSGGAGVLDSRPRKPHRRGVRCRGPWAGPPGHIRPA